MTKSIINVLFTKKVTMKFIFLILFLQIHLLSVFHQKLIAQIKYPTSIEEARTLIDSTNLLLKEKSNPEALQKIIRAYQYLLPFCDNTPLDFYNAVKIYSIVLKENKLSDQIDDILSESIKCNSKKDSVNIIFKIKTLKLKAKYAFENSKTTDAIESLNLALTYFNHLSQIDYNEKIFIYRELYKYYNSISKYPESRSMLDSAIILTKISGSDTTLLLASLYNLYSTSFENTYDIQNSIFYCKKALAIIQNHEQTDSILLASTLNTLGFKYLKLNQANNSLEYLLLAEEIIKSKVGEKNNLIFYNLSNTGKAYLEIKNFEKSFQYFKKALDIKLKYSKSQSDLFYQKIDLGTYYYLTNQFDSAYQYFIDCYKIIKQNSKNTIDQGTLALWVGRCEIQRSNYANALNYISEDKEILNKHSKLIFPELVKADFEMARLYKHWYYSTKNDSFLLLSLIEFNRSEDIAINFISQNTSDDEQIKMIQIAKPFLESHIELLYSQYKSDSSIIHLEKIWSLSEYMHGLSLLQRISDSKAKSFSNIPESEIFKENQIKKELLKLNQERANNLYNKNLSITDSLIVHLDLLISEKLFEHKKFVNKLQTNYPNYYKLRYNNKSLSILKLQSTLNKNQSLVEYFVGDTTIITLVINSNFAYLYSQKRPLNYDTKITRFNYGLTSYYSGANKNQEFYKKSIMDFTKASQELYGILIQPIKKYLKSHVIVIPDEELNSIPFEALITEIPKDLRNFKSYDYLIYHYNFSYNYSAIINREMQERKNENFSFNLFAMAPFESSVTSNINKNRDIDLTLRFGLTELPYSGEEINRIEKYSSSNTKIFKNKEASKSNFLNYGLNSKIIHLATHGKCNSIEGEFSYIALFGDSLGSSLITGAEIYNLSIPAEMVCLSACESAKGNNITGNGVKSLTHGFAFAGSKSIVASLWKVNDRSTMEIMDKFYLELFQNKKKKDIALSIAKRTLIKKNPTAFGHPFFWSGFIAIGDMSPLSK